MIPHTHQNLTDKELYKLCQTYGENALMWRRKFTGLLPEVNRRKLYEKKGSTSIFEFAKKLCGLSEEQVRRVLNLEEKFKDKPALHHALITGKVSINKLTRIASVATSENESFWSEKALQLSKSALETLVKDIKIENDLIETKNESKSVPGHRSEEARKFLPGQISEELQLDADVKAELLQLQAKDIDVNQVLREFLEQRKLEITREKERLSAETETAVTASGREVGASRYIPVKIRRHLKKEHGNKCSISHCYRTAQVIHHTQRFALSARHDPRYLAPLCREHHAIAHAIDAKVQAKKNSS